ncbi:rRNA maturation RNase YbeY [Fusibacter sp. JL298sf-3]
MIELDILNEQGIVLPTELVEQLKRAVETVLENEAIAAECELSLTLTDNAHIRELNAEYRGKDVPTDVLSFPQYDCLVDERPEDPYLYIGDIVISVEQATEQAERYDHSFEREMTYLTVHSVYHLLGYDHIEPSDKVIMREKEKSTLKQLGVFKQ